MTKEQRLASFWLSMMTACGNEDWESELTILDALNNYFKLDSEAVYERMREISKEGKLPNLAAIAKEMDNEEQNMAFWGCFKIAFADLKVQRTEIIRIHAITESLGWPAAYTSFRLIQEIKATKDVKIEGIDFPFEED